MAETEEHIAPAVAEQSPPQFELEQPEDYSQYLLHSKSEIVAVLRSLVQKGALITVYFDQGKSFLLTWHYLTYRPSKIMMKWLIKPC